MNQHDFSLLRINIISRTREGFLDTNKNFSNLFHFFLMIHARFLTLHTSYAKEYARINNVISFKQLLELSINTSKLQDGQLLKTSPIESYARHCGFVERKFDVLVQYNFSFSDHKRLMFSTMHAKFIKCQIFTRIYFYVD